MPELLLESSAGTRSALRLQAGKRWLIGTDPRCSLQLPPGTAEPFHCEVFYSSLQWQVRDLLSASGTLVGGKAAHQQPIASGDVIQVGRERVTFVLEEKEPAVGHLSASSACAARPRKTIQRASALPCVREQLTRGRVQSRFGES